MVEITLDRFNAKNNKFVVDGVELKDVVSVKLEASIECVPKVIIELHPLELKFSGDVDSVLHREIHKNTGNK